KTISAGELRHGLENTAASFDDSRRANVFVIAGDQHSFNPLSPDDHETLAKDLGRIAATAMRRQHAVPDVTAFRREVFVQRETDRCPANDRVADRGNEKDAWHKARWWGV